MANYEHRDALLILAFVSGPSWCRQVSVKHYWIKMTACIIQSQLIFDCSVMSLNECDFTDIDCKLVDTKVKKGFLF